MTLERKVLVVIDLLFDLLHHRLLRELVHRIRIRHHVHRFRRTVLGTRAAIRVVRVDHAVLFDDLEWSFIISWWVSIPFQKLKWTHLLRKPRSANQPFALMYRRANAECRGTVLRCSSVSCLVRALRYLRTGFYTSARTVGRHYDTPVKRVVCLFPIMSIALAVITPFSQTRPRRQNKL